MDAPAADAPRSPTNKEQQLYKILVLGDYAVGKTSLIRRYVHGTFSPNYKLTIGVDFAHKQLEWDDNTIVNLQLWDIAGHERFGSMTSAYYKYAIAAIIVFDLTRPSTFEAVRKWREDLNSKVVLANSQPIPALLIANKCDLEDAKIDRDKLDAFVQKENFIGWFATSAQDDKNIDEAMQFLTKTVLQVAQENLAVQPLAGTVDLTNAAPATAEGATSESGKCCS